MFLSFISLLRRFRFRRAADFGVIFIKSGIALIDAPRVGADDLSLAACRAHSRRHDDAVVVAAVDGAAAKAPDAGDCQAVGQLADLAAEGVEQRRRRLEAVALLDAQPRGVAVLSRPGARRAICTTTASRSMVSPAGRPSMTTPIPLPWLSPKTEILILEP